MRTISIGIIGVALCGFALSACSSSGPASVVAPTAVGVPGASATSIVPATGNGDEGKFYNTPLFIGGGLWTGTTTPNNTQQTGHPGTLTIDFAQNIFVRTTLSWENTPGAENSKCEISSDADTAFAAPVPVTCAKGSVAEHLVVYPSTSPTWYTLTVKLPGNQSKTSDQTKQYSTKVEFTNNVQEVKATWVSTFAGVPNPDTDATVVYKGHVHTPLKGEIQVDADSDPLTYCGMSSTFARDTRADHFHATINLNTLTDTHMDGSYQSISVCDHDAGTFTLNK